MSETKRFSSEVAPLWASVGVAVFLIILMAWFRLGWMNARVAPIGYGVPLIAFVWLRDRRVLWATTIAFAILTIAKYVQLKAVTGMVPISPLADTSLVLVDLFCIAGVIHVIITARSRLVSGNAALETLNHDMAAREEEIARQNEELQSQSEELERQSEELRVTNEELAQRESMLETMLDLSRALTVELTQGQIMERICETLWHLISGSETATAILLKEADHLNVKCHYGFGADGLMETSVPYRDSFAGLVISQMRSGYVEDLSLRPDLKIPRAANGDQPASVLAAPLMVRGRAVGTLEIYSRVKRSWTDQQIALAESLAAQAAISLENGMLFEEVERERSRLSAVLRAVPFGLLICDELCTNIRANPAGAAMLNIASDTPMTIEATFSHIVAMQDGRLIEPTDHPIVLAAREGRETHGVELEWLQPGGRRLFVLISAVPVRERDGKVIGAVSVKADITQLKMLQRELDLRRREAEEANVRKTRFLAAASHDIRTPANAISLLAELIKRTAENPALVHECKQLATDLHASSMSLVELVTNVLDVTRFDTDKLELRESDFPLGAMLDEEVRQAMPLAEAKGIKLEAARVNPPVWLRADRIKLGRVVGNLLSNAIKFTDEGSVKVTAQRQEDGTVSIEVADTGVGIGPEHLAKIFDEFYQITEPSRSRGSGLGLAICKRLTEAMGGRITVISEMKQGSRFVVTLPAELVIASPEAIPGARS